MYLYVRYIALDGVKVRVMWSTLEREVQWSDEIKYPLWRPHTIYKKMMITMIYPIFTSLVTQVTWTWLPVAATHAQAKHGRKAEVTDTVQKPHACQS